MTTFTNVIVPLYDCPNDANFLSTLSDYDEDKNA